MNIQANNTKACGAFAGSDNYDGDDVMKEGQIFGGLYLQGPLSYGLGTQLAYAVDNDRRLWTFLVASCGQKKSLNLLTCRTLTINSIAKNIPLGELAAIFSKILFHPGY